MLKLFPPSLRTVSAIGGLLLLAAAAARAENPHVSLRVERSAPVDTVAQLSRASGVAVELYTPNLPPSQKPGVDPKDTFDWSNTSFSQALRQFCEKHDLRPSRRPGGYVLYPASGNPMPPASQRIGYLEKNGMRLCVRSVSMEDRRSRNHLGEAQDWEDVHMGVTLYCQHPEGEGDSIAGIQNIRARDDQGNFLAPAQGTTMYGGWWGSSYPDEWSGSVSLSAPHPKAKKLQWLEGDLMGYRRMRPIKIEVPLPPPTPSFRKEAGDWLVAVSRYQPEYQEPPDDDRDLPALGVVPAKAGPSMRIRIFYPVRSSVSARAGFGLMPFLLDTAGKVYSPIQTLQGRGAGDGQLTLNDYTLVFPATTAPPAKLVWELVEKSDPVKLFSFRMTDIPIPQSTPFVPKTAPPGQTDGEPVPPAHPFYQMDGGTLSSRVLLGARPAEGTVELGLAPRSGTGWGTLRWTEVPVEAQGAVRLENVKPGQYRLQRRFRPKEGASEPAGGRWLNAEVTVTVTAGKEATVTPLQWTDQPEGKQPAGPASTSKPAGTGTKSPAPRSK